MVINSIEVYTDTSLNDLDIHSVSQNYEKRGASMLIVSQSSQSVQRYSCMLLKQWALLKFIVIKCDLSIQGRYHNFLSIERTCV